MLDKINYIALILEASVKAGLAILDVYKTNFEIEYKLDRSPLTLADKKANQLICQFLAQTGFPVLSEEGKETPFEERKNWKKFWMVDPLDGTKEFVKRNGEFTVNIALIENGKPAMGVVYAPVSDELFLGIDKKGAYKIEKTTRVFVNSESFRNWRKFVNLLPSIAKGGKYRVVASRSHLNSQTKQYIEELQLGHKYIELVSKGSSLKLCLIAEGKADVYPRFAPTMEWDTAAGHAIVSAAGGSVVNPSNNSTLKYNKKDLLNPWFIAFRKNE